MKSQDRLKQVHALVHCNKILQDLTVGDPAICALQAWMQSRITALMQQDDNEAFAGCIKADFRAMYEAAKAMPPSKAMRMVQLAKSDEERKFFAYIADMNLQRTQKEVIKKGLF